MPTKASTKSPRARATRKPVAKALSVAFRKKTSHSASKAGTKIGGQHLGRYAIFAGIAAAAAASAFVLLPDSLSGDVKRKVKEKGKAARSSVHDAEKMMKQAIEAARSYASNALH